MAYKSLTSGIIVRVLLLTAIITGSLYFAIKNGQFFISIIGFCIAAIQVAELVSYLNRTNRVIKTFIESIANEDTTFTLREGQAGNRSTNDLMDSVRKLGTKYSEARIELEAQERFFSILAESSPAGILVVDGNEKIRVSNSCIRDMLKISRLHSMNQLARHNQGFAEAIRTADGKTPSTITLQTGNDETIYISLNAVNLKILREDLKLVVVQDISNELDRQELESWQKLLRILNHEIMNTVAPVTSLSETLKEYFVHEGELIKHNKISDTEIANIVKGLDVIESNSKGLMEFVNSYRHLTRLPKPVMKPVPVRVFLEKISLLYNSPSDGDQSIRKPELICKTEPEELQINMDEDLMTRVIWNLVKNALEASEDTDNALISVKAGLDYRGKPYFSVTDNGKGIPDDIKGDIFVPFFTTKEKGNGIGLSLSRQIVSMHHGRLNYTSGQGKETVFTITFN